MKFTNTIYIIFVLLCFFSSTSTVSATTDMPPHWPWRGVNIDNIDFDVSQLKKALQTVNIKSVQLRLKPRKLVETKHVSPAKAWKQSLDWAARMLDECKRQGVVAILSVEGFPVDPKGGYNHTSPKFWFNTKNQQEIVELASELSMRFAKRGTELVAYQLMSEPVMKIGGKSLRPSKWDLLLTEIIKALRTNDPERWIAVSPAPWGLPSAYKKYKKLPFPRIVYSAHMYEPQSFTHQGIRKFKAQYTYPGIIKGKKWDKGKLKLAMSDLRKFQLTHQVPVWIGEFSSMRWAPGAEEYIIDLVSIFNEYNWSWTYFSLNGWHGWNPDYSHQRMRRKEWKSHKIGISSKRWETLRHIFDTKSGK